MNDPLSVELETYNASLHSLMSDQGKFVVIKGRDIVGIYDTYQDAIKFAYEKFDIEPFLVKRISPAEQISFFTREIFAGCRA